MFGTSFCSPAVEYVDIKPHMPFAYRVGESAGRQTEPARTGAALSVAGELLSKLEQFR